MATEGDAGGYEDIIPARLVQLCLDHFHGSLPAKGKPKVGLEWTVFAGVCAQFPGSAGSAFLSVVSCGTGSKCLGPPDTSAQGDRVHDSHAEVIAKRAFHRYMLKD